jgi:hypothetical protein
MIFSTYLAESLLHEGSDHAVPKSIAKELESLGFRALSDGAYMINPTKRYTDVITVQKDGTGILVMWSVGGKHDNKEITNEETLGLVKEILAKFEAKKGKKLQEAVEKTFQDKKYYVEEKIALSNLAKLTTRNETITELINDAQEYISILNDTKEEFTASLVGRIHPSKKGDHLALGEKAFNSTAKDSEYGYTFSGHDAQTLKEKLNGEILDKNELLKPIITFLKTVKELVEINKQSSMSKE